MARGVALIEHCLWTSCKWMWKITVAHFVLSVAAIVACPTYMTPYARPSAHVAFAISSITCWLTVCSLCTTLVVAPLYYLSVGGWYNWRTAWYMDSTNASEIAADPYTITDLLVLCSHDCPPVSNAQCILRARSH